MIVEYRILKDPLSVVLQHAVNRAIEDGWQPQGGVSVFMWRFWNEQARQYEEEPCYCQAMVRVEEA